MRLIPRSPLRAFAPLDMRKGMVEERASFSSANALRLFGFPNDGSVQLLVYGASLAVSGGLATSWQDASGLGNHLAVSGSVATTTINGRTAAVFDGTNKRFDTSAINLSGNHTIMVYGSCTAVTGRTWCDSKGAAPATRSKIFMRSASTIGFTGVTNQIIYAGTSTTPGLLVGMFTAAGSGSTGILNRVENPGTAAGAGLVGFTLGHDSTASNSGALDGIIAFATIINRHLTAAERTKALRLIMSYHGR